MCRGCLTAADTDSCCPTECALYRGEGCSACLLTDGGSWDCAGKAPGEVSVPACCGRENEGQIFCAKPHARDSSCALRRHGTSHARLSKWPQQQLDEMEERVDHRCLLLQCLMVSGSILQSHSQCGGPTGFHRLYRFGQKRTTVCSVLLAASRMGNRMGLECVGAITSGACDRCVEQRRLTVLPSVCCCCC